MLKFLICPITRAQVFVLILFIFGGLTAQAQVDLKGIVLLIDFADDTEDLTVDRVDSLINGIGYTETDVPSSIRDYWMVQSRDSISLTHDIFGYYRAPETAEWYADHDWTIMYDLLQDALDSLVAQNPDYDWDQLSLNDNPGFEGTFLSINVVTTAWLPGSGGTHYLPWGEWIAPNGVEVYAFTSQPLTSTWDADFVRLFVIAHEIGHAAWQFPDTYDYDGSSFGTGFYTVMSGNQLAGEIEPIGGPFFADAEWVDILDIEPNSTYVLPEDGKAVARFINPSDPNEYFIIEACKQSTLGNAAFPVERGLVIWHVDNNVTTKNTLENMTLAEHYEYSIEQADALFDLENGINQGDAGDIYVEGSLFSAESIPASDWWDGSESGLNINSIQFLDDERISFCNGVCDLSVATEAAKNQFIIYPTLNNGNFYINANAAKTDNYTIDVINHLGQLVFQKRYPLNENEISKPIEINLGATVKGVFFVRIQGEKIGSIITEKVIVR